MINGRLLDKSADQVLPRGGRELLGADYRWWRRLLLFFEVIVVLLGISAPWPLIKARMLAQGRGHWCR